MKIKLNQVKDGVAYINLTDDTGASILATASFRVPENMDDIEAEAIAAIKVKATAILAGEIKRKQVEDSLRTAIETIDIESEVNK